MSQQAVQKSQACRPAFEAPKQMREKRRIRAAQSMVGNHVLLQRKCACGGQGECEECANERQLRLRRQPHGGSPGTVPDIVHQVLRGPSRPLDGTTRADMESRFGKDFGDVRVHTDTHAAESARAVNAHAYTLGRDVVFAAQRYAPQTSQGRRLLAHELTHVVQQRGGAAFQEKLSIGEPGDRFEREADSIAAAVTDGNEAATVELRTGFSRGSIQRDLATPPPAVAPKAQKDLTPAQITEAINFNKARYDEANTKLLQDLLGGPVTGTWTDDNILAIAATQEEFGLHKDGKVGHTTFLFLNREQGLEGMSTRTEDCLMSFRVVGPDRQTFKRLGRTNCYYRGHFRIEADFSPRCNCGHFEFRQFIAGHLHRTRGDVVTELEISEPGEVLPAAFIEDADTADPVPHYGHRADPAGGLVEDHYIDATGNDDQAHGCRYRSEDHPGTPTTFGDCLVGDRYDLLMRFRGEIRRNGTPVQTRFWTAINIANWRP